MRGSAGEDPLAADQRTLVVAALAMVALVSVGVVSSALFAGSACTRIEPSPLGPGTAVAGVAGLAELDWHDGSASDLAAAFATLAADLGPVTGVAVVDGAERLAHAPDGVAALGGVTSLLSAAGDEVRTRADVGEGQVVGSGSPLYTLAATNPLTGQVDALQPLGATLVGLTCVDTATVGTPLAFLLDAGDGQLLVLRVGEDGSDPVLELRDELAGRLWAPRLDLAPGSPGVLGELVHARLGPSSVVVAGPAVPGASRAVVSSFARADGTLRWERTGDALGLRGGDEPAQLVEVLAVGDAVAVLAVSPDLEAVAAAASTPIRLIGLDPDDATVRWDVVLEAGERIQATATAGQRTWLVLAGGAAHRLVVVEPNGGIRTVASFDGDQQQAGLAVLPDGRALVTSGGTVTLAQHDDLTGGAATTVVTGVDVLDVLVHPAGTSLLVGSVTAPDERVVVTYGR